LQSIADRQCQRPTNELLHQHLRVLQHQVDHRSGSIGFHLLAARDEQVELRRARGCEGSQQVVDQ
jgi:hypothetical protein